MARKRQHEDPSNDPYLTTPTAMQVSAPEPEVPLIDQSPLIGDATARDRRDIHVAPAKRWTLVTGGVFTNHGFRTTMRAGKVLDEANFDIPFLVGQGAQLRAVE
jgi:hypothetical protein